METLRKCPPCFLALAIALSVLSVAMATVFFEERFDDGWEGRWVMSDWKKNEDAAGKWNHTSGNWSGDPNDKGIQTAEDYKYYAISAEFPEFSNEHRTLVFQFSVKHEQKLNCGGGYMKLLSGIIDQKNFGSDTPYSIMFGPDICGETSKKVHAILAHNGKYHNVKKDISWDKDQLTHVYTLIIHPDASYRILIDSEEKESGSLFTDWGILPPKEIRDPEAKKPEDWDDRAYIIDPEHKKPEGYDEIPKEIPDLFAEKPEDWNADEKGEWKPPMIPNPEYKGPWKIKKIRNPDYKGKWEAPMIENPDYEEDPGIYIYPNMRYAAIELWQAEKKAFEKVQKKVAEEEGILASTIDDEHDDEPDDEEPDFSDIMKKEKGHDEL
ncbi:uncharacterized protein A4U43_C05F1510 [Asparagus officinalis]|uniref:Calreticulin n=1 Tax=Asparagus officinalis TaxID=4686 RepID=A0A5P1EU33_ASPOF|nr:uncharacterized protein A4U43_C05F1510 [Asparagus officinalis]